MCQQCEWWQTFEQQDIFLNPDDHAYRSTRTLPVCKHALLHVRTVTPKGSVTEKLYSQPPCSIYVHIGRCSKQRLTPSQALELYPLRKT